MSDLIAFLNARLDEDEAIADAYAALLVVGPGGPARVLREVEVWRRIILESQTLGLDAKYAGTERETGFGLALSFALKAKAAVWSDHPDYAPDSPEWKI